MSRDRGVDALHFDGHSFQVNSVHHTIHQVVSLWIKFPAFSVHVDLGLLLEKINIHQFFFKLRFI